MASVFLNYSRHLVENCPENEVEATCRFCLDHIPWDEVDNFHQLLMEKYGLLRTLEICFDSVTTVRGGLLMRRLKKEAEKNSLGSGLNRCPKEPKLMEYYREAVRRQLFPTPEPPRVF